MMRLCVSTREKGELFSQISCNRLDFSIKLHRWLAHLSSPSGLLEAAPRQIGVALVVGVDPDDAGADAGRKFVGEIDVFGPDACSEAIV